MDFFLDLASDLLWEFDFFTLFSPVKLKLKVTMLVVILVTKEVEGSLHHLVELE